MNQALEAKYGRLCLDWRESKKNSISPNGNPQTKNPECGGVQYWFHSGNIFTTQAMWDAHDNLLKQQACIKNRTDALDGGVKGKYTYTPAGPPSCGQVVWLCNGEEYGSLEAYESTSCGTPPPQPGPPPPPAYCANFRPHSICGNEAWRRRYKDHPLCICS